MSQPIFIPNGVALYPFTTPFIGQKDLFAKLQTEIRNHLSAGEVPNIMVMRGPWGSGKSRLGFEVCAQLLGNSKGWVPEKGISPSSLLPQEDASRCLPLFLRYSDVLDYDTNPTNILPLCFLKALEQVVYAASKTHSRDRLQTDCRLRLEGMDISVPELKRLLSTVTAENAVQSAQQVAEWLGRKVTRILLVVDEVETAGERSPDEMPEGMDEEESKAERNDIDILAQGCKEIANENVTPGVDYLLLASDASYSSFFLSGALQSARITTLDFQPVTFDQIDILRDAYREFNINFPDHLEEAAFFVANRNFRWYNWLMSRLYEAHRRQPVATHWQLLEREAKVVSGPAEIFNLRELETSLTGRADVDEKLKRIIFAMLPTPESAIDAVTRSAIENQPVISRLAGVKLISPELAFELRSRSFAVAGDRAERGGVSIEITSLLSAFQLFGSHSGEFFFYTDLKEFEQQVMLLYPAIDDVSICRDFHQIFLGRHVEQGGSKAFGPSFELLERLNRKWKRLRESAFLSNPVKYAQLQSVREAEKRRNPTDMRQHLANGMANLIFEERWKPKDKVGREQIKLGSGILVDISELSLSSTITAQSNWKVSPYDVVAIVVADADTTTLVRDLKSIRARVGLAPVILLVMDRERYEQLEQGDKAFHEGEVYPRELLVEIETPQTSADYHVCLNFGYARTIGFWLNDIAPGRWLQRSQSLRKKAQEEWDKGLKIVNDRGWVMRPLYQKAGRGADNLVAYVEAVVYGEDLNYILNQNPEILSAKRDYDDAREYLEPVFDEQDRTVLTTCHLHILSRMREGVDVSLASPLLREVLYQGYLRVTAVEALKQNLEYLRARGILRLNEDTHKYKAQTPTELKALLDEGERTIREYMTQRDELMIFYEGTLNSFRMRDTDIDPLLRQLEEHRKTLRNKYQGDLMSWGSELLEQYATFCSECRKTLTQISDPSAERAYLDISVDVIDEAWPKLIGEKFILEGNVAHRIRFLIQYQKEYQRKREAVLTEAQQRQREIAQKLKVDHPAFPWTTVEDTICAIIADLERNTTEDGFDLHSPDLAKDDAYPSFSLRRLLTQSRLKEAYARLVRYHEHLLGSTGGIWKRTVELITKWDKEVRLSAERALNQWEELNKYLRDAGSERVFLDEREEDRERIASAFSTLPLRPGAAGLNAISEALETLQREAIKLEDDIKAERKRLDGELIEGISDLKGSRILPKLVDRARLQGIYLAVENPEDIARQRDLLYKEKKAKISELGRELDARGRELVGKFPGTSHEDWEIYKRVISSLYRETRDYGYDFDSEMVDGVVDDEKITRLQNLGLLSAEKKWKIRP